MRDNVAWGAVGRPVNDDAVWRALDMVEAGSFVRSLPHGVDTYVVRGWRMRRAAAAPTCRAVSGSGSPWLARSTVTLR